MPKLGTAHLTKCVCCNTPKTFTVSEHEGMPYTTREVYKIVVNYPHTDRILEFVGMDRGSCIMQAEVAKQEGDTVMLMISENTVELLYKEKIEL